MKLFHFGKLSRIEAVKLRRKGKACLQRPNTAIQPIHICIPAFKMASRGIQRQLYIYIYMNLIRKFLEYVRRKYFDNYNIVDSTHTLNSKPSMNFIYDWWTLSLSFELYALLQFYCTAFARTLRINYKGRC